MIDLVYKDGAIAPSFNVALRWINSVQFTNGLLASINYYDTNQNVQALVVSGKQTGTGPEAYQVLSTQNPYFVADVIETNPELVFMLHGEVYIWYDPETKEYRRCWAENGIEKNELITEPVTVTTYAGKIYDIVPGCEIFNSYNYYSKEDINRLIQELSEKYDIQIDSLQTTTSPLEPVFTLLSPAVNVLPKKSDSTVSFGISLFKGDQDISDSTDATYRINNVPAAAGTKVMTVSVKDCTEKLTPQSVTNDVAIYTLRVSYPGYQPVYKAQKLIFVNPVIFAVVSGNTTAPSDYAISTSGKTEYISPETGCSWSGSLKDQKLVIAFPVSLGKISHIFDINGLDYINDYTQLDYTFYGERYIVLVKKTATTIQDFSQTLVFNQD